MPYLHEVTHFYWHRYNNIIPMCHYPLIKYSLIQVYTQGLRSVNHGKLFMITIDMIRGPCLFYCIGAKQTKQQNKQGLLDMANPGVLLKQPTLHYCPLPCKPVSVCNMPVIVKDSGDQVVISKDLVNSIRCSRKKKQHQEMPSIDSIMSCLYQVTMTCLPGSQF